MTPLRPNSGESEDLGMTQQTEREVDTEAGFYIEDEPATWLAFVKAVRQYGEQFDAMTKFMGGNRDAAAEILAGSMLSYLAAEHAVFVRAARPDAAPCWFCRREVPADALIAGYDTFEEQRLACNTCNDAIQWLNAHGLVISRTPA